MKTEWDTAGATQQACEYCYELAWVFMKRILATRGIVVNSPKETFRKAALEELIEDPEQWFRFQNIRNLTVHTYEEETQEEVLESFDSFSQALKKFVEKVGTLL